MKRERDMSCKLRFKWLGPYQICNSVKDKGTYMLKKLDRLQLASKFAGDKLKKFHARHQIQIDHIPNLEHKEILTLNDFFVSNDNSDFFNTFDNFNF